MDLYLHFVKARITTKTKMMTTFRERVITVKSSENERERERDIEQASKRIYEQSVAVWSFKEAT